ncbi:queuosine precursor transporter [Kocuria sp. JC486]|uniref:Probable queuosine precursor transporter n=1 Tax=Kocuria soli TaxID=2485125 RepID=A0A3N3ZTR4_9MICC|nr:MULTISPECIES: queuosine precursor transporter [Kocuria]NHU86168.1 queuosine precursor transporter [Kocuria sp. JC486]ROZ65700.1 VUT family protein [Kocuria soli]
MTSESSSETSAEPASGHAVAAPATANTSDNTSDSASAPHFAPRTRTTFDLFVAAYAVVLILSNIGATKGVQIGPVLTDGGFFLFPIAYVLGDVVSEVWGFRAARRAIITSFAAALFASICFWIIIALPAASFYEGQEAFVQVLGPVPLIVAGSLLGFLVGQLLNSWVLVRLKSKTREKHLWARLISSTLVGELVDTVIFCAVAAPIIGIQTAGQFVNYVVVGYVWKCLVEVLVLPVTYVVVARLKKTEPYWGDEQRRVAL